jgi:hypothetical protein
MQTKPGAVAYAVILAIQEAGIQGLLFEAKVHKNPS